jgi:hypothetical protein
MPCRPSVIGLMINARFSASRERPHERRYSPPARLSFVAIFASPFLYAPMATLIAYSFIPQLLALGRFSRLQLTVLADERDVGYPAVTQIAVCPIVATISRWQAALATAPAHGSRAKGFMR